MIRTCAYAICRNEEIHIEDWFNRMKDCDCIVFLDTGSTDSTINLLNKCKLEHENLFIYELENPPKLIDFSECRNFALNKARYNANKIDPECTWVYICFDLDEFIEENGIQKLKENWSDDYDIYQVYCTNAFSGMPYNYRIHSNNPEFHWENSIHEMLCLKSKKEKEWNIGCPIQIAYEHNQDLTKERNYFKHLKKAYESDPTNIRTLLYLSWEEYNAQDYESWYKHNKECLYQLENNENDPYYRYPEYMLFSYFNLVDYNIMKRNFALANILLNKAKKIVDSGDFPSVRRLPYTKAKVLWNLGLKKQSIEYYKQCLKIESPYLSVDGDNNFNDGEIYNTLSIAYWDIQDYKNSLVYAELAYDYDKENELYRDNLGIIRNYCSENFIEDIENSKENKICVYAISKNEVQFIDRWLDSMSEADYVVVLDTGSTDGTFEKLQTDDRIYKVEQKIIDPWRFDTARNESLLLAPDDANILISTDLDEILDPGWADVLRSKWIEGFHVRGEYRYAWSHDEAGNPARIFVYNKIHDRSWFWQAPVHEFLAREGESCESYNYDETLNLFHDNVFLHHYPDFQKSRASYLPLLELRAEENPDDYYGLYYLSNEYFYRGLYDKSIETLNFIVNKFANSYTSVELAAAYLFLGDNYRIKEDKIEAINQYNKSIQVDKTYRESYLKAAEVLNELEQFELAIGYVKAALRLAYRHYSWVEGDTSWKEQPYDIFAVSYYYLGNKELAEENINKALEYNSNDERLKKNKQYIDNMT